MDTLQYVYSTSESEDDDVESPFPPPPKESSNMPSASSSSSKKLTELVESCSSGRRSTKSPPLERRGSTDRKHHSPESGRGRSSESRGRSSPSSKSERRSGSCRERRSHGRDRHHRDRSKDRRRDRSREHRYDRRSRSRSPRRGSHSDSQKRKSKDRSRSPPPRKPFDAKNKLYILTKMGIDYKGTEIVDFPNRPGAGSGGTSSSSSNAGANPGSALPQYYNPLTINAGKYAEQIAKRKLLWNNKKAEKVETAPASNIWQGAKFSQDTDGKLTAKFQRLMGMKDGAAGTPSGSGKGQELIKKQEELFSSMEMQYEVARATTHTQRGVGLGFGPRHIP